MPSAVPNLTDWHTWVSLLTSIAAIATVILHRDLSAYVPVVSISAAALTNMVLMVTKHQYAKALVVAASAIETINPVVTASTVTAKTGV